VNPITDLSGLHALLPVQLDIATERGWGADVVDRWRDLHAILPPLPRGYMVFEDGRLVGTEERDGQQLLPCTEFKDMEGQNEEDPELSAIFPFELFGLDRPERQVAINTFRARLNTWPDAFPMLIAVCAARLGLTREASTCLRAHRNATQRFPSGHTIFFGGRRSVHPCQPDLSGAPWLDSLGEIAMTLQELLVQETPAGVRLAPAWDLDIPVHFRLRTAFAGWVEVKHERPGVTFVKTEKPLAQKDGNRFDEGFLNRGCGRLSHRVGDEGSL
jgi:hypothetical protein